VLLFSSPIPWPTTHRGVQCSTSMSGFALEGSCSASCTLLHTDSIDRLRALQRASCQQTTTNRTPIPRPQEWPPGHPVIAEHWPSANIRYVFHQHGFYLFGQSSLLQSSWAHDMMTMTPTLVQARSSLDSPARPLEIGLGDQGWSSSGKAAFLTTMRCESCSSPVCDAHCVPDDRV
jgi:hypothetical protein